ncbi:MAG: hypothetical protein IPM51_09520 [Sphingobacteriaceae bacterium]|nr:hypothetical protein [Sphingobacteriaceae bacterium]
MSSDIKNNLFIIIERMWLVGAALGVLITVYFLIVGDNDSALFFFAFFILSSVLYLARKSQRKKQEAYLNQKNQNNKPKN